MRQLTDYRLSDPKMPPTLGSNAEREHLWKARRDDT